MKPWYDIGSLEESFTSMLVFRVEVKGDAIEVFPDETLDIACVNSVTIEKKGSGIWVYYSSWVYSRDFFFGFDEEEDFWWSFEFYFPECFS